MCLIVPECGCEKLKIDPSDLEILSCKYPSLAGSSGSLERDGICLCKSQGIKYGLEIENYPDYSMPKRTLVYDASEYEKEASENYPFCLIEADYVNPEDYQTELRQFFQAMQLRNDRRKLAELFETEEFQNLSTRTQKIIAIHLENKKIEKKIIEEEQPMCKALRDWEREAKREGRKEGRKEGKREGLLYALKNLMDYSQLTVEQAMDILKITGEDRTALKALL